MECTIDTLLLTTNESQAACSMTLLVLELLGGADDPAEASYTLTQPVSFTSAVLRAVDIHAPGPALSHSWNGTQTGQSGNTRTAYAPLYVDLDGLADDRAVLFHSSTEDDYAPRTVIPIGDSKSDRHELRSLNLPLTSGSEVTLPAGSIITARLFYRSVEDGVFGDITELPVRVPDGEGGDTTTAAWANDARLALYI